MRTSSFGYLVNQGAKNVWRNRLMSLASIGILSACLLLIGSSFLLAQNLEQMIRFVEDQNEVIFFLKDDASQESIDDLGAKLSADENLTKVTFITKEQALEDAKADYGDVLEGLSGDENPLPASYRASVKNLASFQTTLSQYQTHTSVEKMEAPTDAANTLVGIRQIANIIVIAIIGALSLVSLIVISNTIRASVFARRREINIMKYVGATDNFIRLPFVVEGMVIGIISAGLSFFILALGYSALMNVITGDSSTFLAQLTNSLIPFGDVMWGLLALFVVAGVAIGTLASVMSIRSHLKV